MFVAATSTDVHDTGFNPARGPERVHAPRLRVHEAADPQRPAVEAFIGEVYARRHGAVVRHFMPALVSLHDGNTVVAAAGYRLATGPLFLERYLDAPIEALLAAHAAPPDDEAPSPPVARRRIAEVGHLSATRAGEGRRLIQALALQLARLRVEWVVSTLTEELRHLFVRMGVTPVELGTADPRRLGAETADWGRYYDHRPTVLAGHLPMAMRRLGLQRAAS